jgi:hypothetical protein
MEKVNVEMPELREGDLLSFEDDEAEFFKVAEVLGAGETEAGYQENRRYKLMSIGGAWANTIYIAGHEEIAGGVEFTGTRIFRQIY